MIKIFDNVATRMNAPQNSGDEDMTTIAGLWGYASWAVMCQKPSELSFHLTSVHLQLEAAL